MRANEVLQWQVLTYGDTKAGDALSLTLCNDSIPDSLVMRLSVSDNHHHLGSTGSATIDWIETLLTEESTHKFPLSLLSSTIQFC